MLQSLKVKNYALIEDVSLEFDSGLNIITGETGAGKSILIDALGLVLGKRADNSSIKSKESKCVIEASFNIKSYKIKGFFDEHDLDYDEHCIIRREITNSGKSRSFVNDTPATLNTLTSLASYLIDIHSQYDNLQLFQEDFAYHLLDELSGVAMKQKEFENLFTSWHLLKKKLSDLRQKDSELAREREFNQFLFDELEAAELKAGEEVELEQERAILDHAEDLLKNIQQASQSMAESDLSIIQQLNSLISLFNGLPVGDLQSRMKSCLIELEDIYAEMGHLGQNVQLDPARLEEVNDRLSLLFGLRSKHRLANLEELIEFKSSIENKLLASTELGSKINAVESELDRTEKHLNTQADELSQLRFNQIEQINVELNKNLPQLGMPHSKLRLNLGSSQELNKYGRNSLVLELSSDNGESFNMIKKSASGGELSRINLLIKQILSDYIYLATSIFDEIDTGVSGEVARKVGGVMKNMAHNQQLIVITHLAQIASLGDKHFYVYKEDSNGVHTYVKSLDEKERIHEIAKMISGDQLTESAIQQSKTLLKGK
ncbi:MAG: DNA repair protein RecN [Bacteroidia bacterium]